MTLREAVIIVLSKARGAMSYQEIWDEIDRRGLFQSNGETPWQTVGSILYAEPAAFRKVARGRFELKRRGTAGRVRDAEPSAHRRTRPAPRSRGDLLSAISQVLEDADAALHYKEVTDRVLRQRLWSTNGRTPEQTVGAYLYKYKDLFEQVSRGTFKLRRGRSAMPSRRVDSSGRADGYEFEHRTAELLKRMGLTVTEVTKASGDRGVDIWAEHTKKTGENVRVGVQTKCWNGGKIPLKDVRDLRGSIDAEDIGILVTTVGFSTEAWRLANEKPRPRLVLVDGDKLAELDKMTDTKLREYVGNLLG